MVRLGACLLTILVLGALRADLDQQKFDTRYTLAAPPKGLRYFTFGFDDLIGDFLWLRYIQDQGACKPFKSLDLKAKFATVENKLRCANSWSFAMLDNITNISPRFRMPYATGALDLAILANDQDGAGIIFEKALKQFPTDWSIAYRSAYFYMFEKREPDHAAMLLMQAYKTGGPKWLPMLASRMYSAEGQYHLGLTTLTNLLNETSDPDYRKRLEARIANLKSLQDASQRKPSSN